MLGSLSIRYSVIVSLRSFRFGPTTAGKPVKMVRVCVCVWVGGCMCVGVCGGVCVCVYYFLTTFLKSFLAGP